MGKRQWGKSGGGELQDVHGEDDPEEVEAREDDVPDCQSVRRTVRVRIILDRGEKGGGLGKNPPNKSLKEGFS